MKNSLSNRVDDKSLKIVFVLSPSSLFWMGYNSAAVREGLSEKQSNTHTNKQAKQINNKKWTDENKQASKKKKKKSKVIKKTKHSNNNYNNNKSKTFSCCSSECRWRETLQYVIQLQWRRVSNFLQRSRQRQQRHCLLTQQLHSHGYWSPRQLDGGPGRTVHHQQNCHLWSSGM